MQVLSAVPQASYESFTHDLQHLHTNSALMKELVLPVWLSSASRKISRYSPCSLTLTEFRDFALVIMACSSSRWKGKCFDSALFSTAEDRLPYKVVLSMRHSIPPESIAGRLLCLSGLQSFVSTGKQSLLHCLYCYVYKSPGHCCLFVGISVLELQAQK